MAMTGMPGARATDAEMSLVVVGRYESDLRIKAAEAKRHSSTIGILVSIAALVFAYDVLSVVIGH